MANANSKITTTGNFKNVRARELDFVTRFAMAWTALQQILGITRPIKKVPGTQLVSYKTSIDLVDGNVGEGEEIPYSQADVEEVVREDLKIEKYAKAVTIESVNKYGAEIAVIKTDEEFHNSLLMMVLSKFYKFLLTGALKSKEMTWQMALAMARGNVIDKFNKIRKTVTDVVAFVNVLDVYQHLGESNITVQTKFGLTYMENFMGYSKIFMLSEPDIPRGTVVALPVENIDLYYVDPSDSDFARLGLEYVVDGDTNLIGFHAEGDYKRAIGDSYAIMGMELWAEYIDGIAVVEVGEPGIELDETTLSLTTDDEPVQLNAITAPSNVSVTWSSSADTYATVSDTGVVTPVAAGTATITAKMTYNGTQYSATCAVTVGGV